MHNNTTTSETVTVDCFSYREAVWARESHIVNGHSVTKIKRNPDTGLWSFDILDA